VVTIVKKSNVRNLTRTLAVVSLLAPVSAHPLGIGGIKLHSALNQNLHAEIALMLSGGEDAADIKVNLAPPDKFDEAGVPWSSFLTKIKFERSGNVIRLSSREALKEPFLDFLLEVSWPKGTLYRQFTVLVDPPATYRQATIPVVTQAQSYASEPAYVPERQAVSKPIAKTQRSFDSPSEYGPTRPNDTLWKVAERISRYSGVSVEQMMIALYQANPRAFYKENVNALMAGKSLKIPEKAVIIKLSRKQAIAEFNRQTAAWKNRELPVPVETAAAPEASAVKDAVVDNQLTLAAPAETTVADNTVIAPGTEQAVAENKTGSEKPATASEQAAQTPETSNAATDAATQNRLAALETQLAEMQKMLALKDQQLSALQNQSHAKPPADGAQVVQPATTDKVVEAVRPVTQSGVRPQPKPVDKPAVQDDSSTDNTYFMNVGATGVGILSLLGWLWWRKRKVEEETSAESMFASSMLNIKEAADSFAPPKADAPSGYGVEAVGESSFLSEFTPSDFDAFDTNQSEIDPISEADVYLAYGRYQQAEDLIRQAIKDQPDRNECKLKLLEIFYANENKKAFETYANELAAAGKNEQAEFWAKVAEMGRELCPDSVLFFSDEMKKSQKIEAAAVNTFVAAAQSDGLELNEDDEMNLAGFDEALNGAAANETLEAKNNELDFDLNSFEIEDDLGEDEQGNNDAIDFDLSSFQVKPTEATDTANLAAAETEDEYEYESFDFDVPLKHKESKESALLDLSAAENAEEGFKAIDLSDDSNFVLAADFGSDSFDTDFDFNFDLNLNNPVAGTTVPADEQGGETGVFDLTDMDEFETKLDLAKAYIDMGDAESAKSIVEDVVVKGSAEQQRAAQTILNELK
jgi:pilus assembly protein FimV